MAIFLHLALVFVAVVRYAHAQCPNLVAAYHPTLRTDSFNNTWFLVPVSSTAVQKALNANYGPGVVLLADIPSSDKSLFPSGFSANDHPVLVNAGLTDDIRMSVFQIDGALLNGQTYVPYVRRSYSKPGTILTAQLNGYLAGPDNNVVAGLVPSLVSTLIEGFPTRLGQFAPTRDAYQLNSGGVYSNKVAWAVLPNDVSGPGGYIEALDFSFKSGQVSNAMLTLFKKIINLPAILSGIYLLTNTCQRNQYYFNNDTGVMMPRVGTVTLGPAADGLGPQLKGILQAASPDGSGVYNGVEGFSACAQNVNYNPQNCDDASTSVDQSAL